MALRFCIVVVVLVVVPLLSGAEDIKVPNGGPWGALGPRILCPPGSYAYAFSIQVEAKLSGGDDTAMNGLQLYCKKDDSPTDVPIASEGPFGEWTMPKECPSGRLDAFQLRVEPPRGVGIDDTAANNIRFHCSGGGKLLGDGLNWGAWGPWSDTCAHGVCGLQARTEGRLGHGSSADDTGLNDVILICCTSDSTATGWRWWRMLSSW
ncbi:vitelline membrane outer layer protein 1-like [Engraulis encrasicolus]|uniref:vitelline membrane outer layer protein 1-like n=1 Tax=Engraulis encrasicolus TaxID=184585 RepID=UPI002FD1D000